MVGSTLNATLSLDAIDHPIERTIDHPIDRTGQHGIDTAIETALLETVVVETPTDRLAEMSGRTPAELEKGMLEAESFFRANRGLWTRSSRESATPFPAVDFGSHANRGATAPHIRRVDHPPTRPPLTRQPLTRSPANHLSHPNGSWMSGRSRLQRRLQRHRVLDRQRQGHLAPPFRLRPPHGGEDGRGGVARERAPRATTVCHPQERRCHGVPRRVDRSCGRPPHDQPPARAPAGDAPPHVESRVELPPLRGLAVDDGACGVHAEGDQGERTSCSWSSSFSLSLLRSLFFHLPHPSISSSPPCPPPVCRWAGTPTATTCPAPSGPT